MQSNHDVMAANTIQIVLKFVLGTTCKLLFLFNLKDMNSQNYVDQKTLFDFVLVGLRSSGPEKFAEFPDAIDAWLAFQMVD